MSWTEEQRAIAVAELRDDPEERGYEDMSDEEVAIDMALQIWQKSPATVDVRAGSIAARLTLQEMTAWRTSAIPDVATAWAIFAAILASDGAIRGDRLMEQALAFGPSPGLGLFSADSVEAVAALITKQNRCEVLGLPRVKAGWVAKIRGEWDNG